MSFWKSGKKTKRIMAFLLAAVLCLNGWLDLGFAVFALDDVNTMSFNSTKPDEEELQEEETKTEESKTEEPKAEEPQAEVPAADMADTPIDLSTCVVYIKTIDTGTEIETKAEDYEVIYTGSEISFTSDQIVVKDKDDTSIVPSLLSIDVTGNTDAGSEVTIKISPAAGISTITGETAVTLEIQKKDFVPGLMTINITEESYEVTDQAIEPEPEVTVDGNTWIKDSDYTVEYQDNTGITDDAKIIITPVEDGTYSKNYNYTTGVTVQKTFKITDVKTELADAEVIITLSEESYEETGSQITPEPEVTVDGINWKKYEDTDAGRDGDYTVTYANNTQVTDNAEIIITPTANGTNSQTYKGTYTHYFKITVQKPENAEATIDDSTPKNDNAEEGWYTGTVVLKAPTEWEIRGTDENSWESTVTSDKLSMDAITGEYIYYLRRIDTTITGYEKRIEFYIDENLPVINDLSITNEDEWVIDEKAITFKVTDESELKDVYYTLNKNGDKVDSVLKDETSGKYTLVIQDEIGQDGKNYYFYAVDKAGNVNEADAVINVKKIDKSAPEFSLEKSIYWKNNQADLEIALGVVDPQIDGKDASGVTSIEVDTARKAEGITIDTASNTATITITEAGKYTYGAIAKDAVGNEVLSTDIVVGVDNTEPNLSIVLDDLDGENKYEDEQNNVFWFSGKDVTIPVTVEDSGDETDKAPYRVEYTCGDSEFKEGNIRVLVSGQEGNYESGSLPVNLSDVANEPQTYYFRAVDEAGNIAEVQSVTIAYDSTKPEITEVEFTQDSNKDNWINGNELSGDYVTVRIEASDAQTGIGVNENEKPDIQYRYNNSEWLEPDEIQREDGTNFYLLGISKAMIGDITKVDWDFRVANNVQEQSNGYKVSEVGIDTTLPSNVAYIQFFSDTTGDNTGGSTENGNWVSSIRNMAGTAWNRIWGKSEIKFEVYVYDATSGIEKEDVIVLECDKGKIKDLQDITGEKASITAEDGTFLGNYTVYRGTITTSDSEYLAASNFKITSVTDIAGNTLSEEITLQKADENRNIIYLDSVTPKLTVTSNVVSGNLDVAKKYYTNADNVSVTLTIDERFFNERGEQDSPVYPVIELYRREIQFGADFVKQEYANQNWTQISGTYQWQATVELPKETGKEYEYQIVTQYTDPSGNHLNGNGVNEETGIFTSSVIVVDAIAPVLTYSVNPATGCFVDGNAVYKNVSDKDDLTVNVVLDENASYYNKDNLTIEIVNKDSSAVVYAVTNKDVAANERVHVFNFAFDEEEQIKDGRYFVRIKYVDRAGNVLVKNVVENEKDVSAQGIYESNIYVIDHVMPLFDVSYNDAVRNVNVGGEDLTGENSKKPQKSYTAYYNNGIKATITVDEKFTNSNTSEELPLNSLQHHSLIVKKDGSPIYSINLMDDSDKTAESDVDVKWEKVGTQYKATINIPAKADHSTDGDYQIVFSARDCAENMIVEKNTSNVSVTGMLDKGTYTGPVLILDSTAPEMVLSYNMTPSHENMTDKDGNLRDYFDRRDAVFQITVKDRNIRYDELKKELLKTTAVDVEGNVISDSKTVYGTVLQDKVNDITALTVEHAMGNAAAAVWNVPLSLQTEANYAVPVDFTDLAGNRAVITDQTDAAQKGEFKKYTQGCTKYITMDSTEPQLSFEYSVDDGANYSLWGFLFSQATMTLTVTTEDNISGIYSVNPEILGMDGEKIKEVGITLTGAPKKTFVHQYHIPIEGADFKGGINVKTYDYSLNEKERTRGYIVETSEKHSETSVAKITTLTQPSRSVGGEDYYNSDINLNLLLTDTYSGIASLEYQLGSDGEVTENYKDAAGRDIGSLGEDANAKIIYEYNKDLRLSAENNNRNEVLVTASLVDNVGHTNEIEQKYIIDVTDPKIEVTYDDNSPYNEFYYNKPRTATVKITERNFDPEDVEFIITSTDGAEPNIGSWSQSGSDDDTVNTCQVTFDQDSDYTFTLEFQDMAGNKAEYSQIDEFTIDKTLPEMTVTYNNNEFLNEYYYNAARTATIDIVEHNFDPEGIKIHITSEGVDRGLASISSWTKNGDHNIATVTFDDDAEYTFDIEGIDLANNELEDYEADHFVVDQTVPELEIFDIENMSANNGEVRPGIRYYDKNYDQDGTVVVFKGYHNGVQEMSGEKSLQMNGLELKLYDIPHTQENDDIYTMEATVYDLAGNSSEESVIFSVNRFGSVYTFDEATNALVGDKGKYYTNKEQDIVIMETNVDTLEFKEITCNLNGGLTTLTEGQDYKVELDGSEATWKQYTYTVYAKNFEEEGTYIITTYSEDKATNTSDNNSKGKSLEFVVDKTNPSLLVSGVENGGQYREDSHEMTLDIEDNIRVSEAVVTINDETITYGAAQINDLDGKLTLSIESADYWQDIKVTVADAAGNQTASEELKVLVTANIFIQFVSNKPLLYGTVGTVSAGALAVWWFIIRKKMKSGV